ncbi:LysR substrate-binding domain-containing protein [Alloyangia pacifica]|uniref:LysR substrate-binding domain-containing protein n=1 Tax=Alloyangia pacifica TaxID=311180 RepID=UPI001CD405D8|nr:LysR substrate-binding domain-containing protein [Alloyangia pacifica]MCA0997787.1 LysR family transcriptional regulator [Alloyangia pacifica]
MDLKLIEDALALLEERNLTRAAARRNVTQPAFSRRIRALEDWIGVPLLDRQTNAVQLLPGLIDNAAEFRAVLARVEQFREAIAQSRPQGRKVELATQHSLATSAVPSVLRQCAEHVPGIDWKVNTMNREDCIAVFLRGDVDILLCYEARGFPPLPFDATITRRLWMHDTLLPIVGGRHRYRLGADGAVPEDVPVIAYPPGSHFGRLMERTGTAHAFGPGRRDMVETDFTVGVFDLVRDGFGVGWVPHSMCREALGSGKVQGLQSRYGAVPIDATLFASTSNELAKILIETGPHGARQALPDISEGRNENKNIHGFRRQ